MSDTPLRRAAAYGLGRVREIWATELLEKMRSEDDQWVVRSAATAMLESNSHPADPRVPRQLTPPSEAAWLIAFAGTLGVGISPGAPATDVLIAALKSKNRDERLAALAYLKRTPSDGVIREIYAAMSGDDAELREAAFLCLWEIGASGHKLPELNGLWGDMMLITNATVVTCEVPNRVLPNHAVYVSGDHIQELGPTPRLEQKVPEIKDN